MKTIFNESQDGLEVFLTIENCPQELQNMLESAGFVYCGNGDFVLSGSTLSEAKALYKNTVKEYKALYVPAKRGAYYPKYDAGRFDYWSDDNDEPLSSVGNELINE